MCESRNVRVCMCVYVCVCVYVLNYVRRFLKMYTFSTDTRQDIGVQSFVSYSVLILCTVFFDFLVHLCQSDHSLGTSLIFPELSRFPPSIYSYYKVDNHSLTRS